MINWIAKRPVAARGDYYCKNKNLKELRNIYHFMPDVWQELKDLQDKVQMPFRDNKTIYDLEERFKAEDKKKEGDEISE